VNGCKTKKASVPSPTGQGYDLPRVEEGTDAFWQRRKIIEVSRGLATLSLTIVD